MSTFPRARLEVQECPGGETPLVLAIVCNDRPPQSWSPHRPLNPPISLLSDSLIKLHAELLRPRLLLTTATSLAYSLLKGQLLPTILLSFKCCALGARFSTSPFILGFHLCASGVPSQISRGVCKFALDVWWLGVGCARAQPALFPDL